MFVCRDELDFDSAPGWMNGRGGGEGDIDRLPSCTVVFVSEGGTPGTFATSVEVSKVGSAGVGGRDCTFSCSFSLSATSFSEEEEEVFDPLLTLALRTKGK